MHFRSPIFWLSRAIIQPMTKRIGILGGTFDPIHFGHLAIAEEARVLLQFDEVLLIPAAQQPLKQAGHQASPLQRLEMTRLACADNPHLQVSSIEIERQGPSYTVDTLEAFAQTGVGELFFIIGADAVAELYRWYAAARVIALAQIVAVARPGAVFDPQLLEQRLPGVGKRLTSLAGPALDISSTSLRQRVAAGKPIRYQTPQAVVEYIEQHRLYQQPRIISEAVTI